MSEDKKIAHILNGIPRTADVRLSTAAPFSQMILSDGLRKGLQRAGYVQPTVVQAAAIPIGKAGIDLLVQSKSGTGKTLIYGSIILENYCTNVMEPQSLIITPTREIADQTTEVLNTIACCINGFRAVCVIGGLSVADDRKRLQKAKCIVGTPGRVLHLIDNNVLNTSQIRILVLDEADKLYTNSFRNDLQQLQNKLTARVQTIACSATFCNNLDNELAKMMLQPVLVSSEKGTTITGLLGVKQFVYELRNETKNLNTSIYEMLAKRDALNYIFSCFVFKQCILFARTQSRADSYCSYLRKDGWSCEYICGGQSQKTRLDIFRRFRDCKFKILLTTDLMARGIDSKHVNLVINLELPQDMVTYLHRIGRAGRFGSHGIAITFLATDKDKPSFNNLLKEMASDVRIMKFPTKPHTPQEARRKQIDFWDFSCPDKEAELYGLYNDYKEEMEVGKMASKDVLLLTATNTTETTTIATSESSIDTQTFQIDSQDSAINGPILTGINNNDDDDNNVVLQQLPLASQEQHLVTQTFSQNGSSQYLISSNTIDDASSIAADSLRSSNQSMAMPKTIKSNLLQILVDQDDYNAKHESNLEQQKDVEKKQQQKQKVPELFDHFDKYIEEVLSDNNNHSTTTHTESSSTSNGPSISSQKLIKLKLLLIDKSTEDNEEKNSLTSLSSLSSALSSSCNESVKDFYNGFDTYMIDENEEQEENGPNKRSNNCNDDNEDGDTDDEGDDAKPSTNEIDGNTFVLSVTTPSIEPQESLSRIIGETSQTTTITNTSASSSKDCNVQHFPSPTLEKSSEESRSNNIQQLRNLSISKIAQVDILPYESSSECDMNEVDTESSSGQTWSNYDSDSDTKSSGFDEAMVFNSNVMNDNDDNDSNDVANDKGAAHNGQSDDVDAVADDVLLYLNINDNALESKDSATEQTMECDDDNDDDDDDDDDNDNDVESLMSFTNFVQNDNFLQNTFENNNDERQSTMMMANQLAYERWINLYWNQIHLIQDYVRMYNHVNQQQQQQP